ELDRFDLPVFEPDHILCLVFGLFLGGLAVKTVVEPDPAKGEEHPHQYEGGLQAHSFDLRIQITTPATRMIPGMANTVMRRTRFSTLLLKGLSPSPSSLGRMLMRLSSSESQATALIKRSRSPTLSSR